MSPEDHRKPFKKVGSPSLAKCTVGFDLGTFLFSKEHLGNIHREKIYFNQLVQELIEIEAFSYGYTINWVLYISLPRIKKYRCLKKVINQTDRKLTAFKKFFSKTGLPGRSIEPFALNY